MAPRASGRGVIIEDFESGNVVLESYPDQDQEPSAWELTTANTYGDSDYALRIYGNSWKSQSITPYALTDTTVWQVAVYIERLGEMQAFGISDGENELLYTFAGDQLPQAEKWWTVYQGAFPAGQWYAYLLPIGEDWLATYGNLSTVTHLIYVNDDDSGSTGRTIFDEIIDVTEDLPVPPFVSIEKSIRSSKRLSANLYRVGIQFYGIVFDPDSDTHVFSWDFGDSTGSSEQNPFHEFLVEADHTYTVSLIAKDETGLAGHDTCQVEVEPGVGDLPITVNFVGDIMTARSYEQPGGIIDTYGIEALFEPTLSILGEAADVSVCNLECPYTDRGEPHPTKSVVFRAKPENIVGIQYAGIDVADIGNNHIIDYGEEGMLQTQELLDSMGIPYSGAGINSYFALQPAFWTESGVRVAFLGQSNRTGRQWNYQPFLDAGYNKPGFAYILPKNLETAIGWTRDLADIVIIQFHSGDEYETEPPSGFKSNGPIPVEAAQIGSEDPEFRFPIEPSPGDRELRRTAVDLGADIVINHHPHVLQGFEAYQGKLIAHSLGNFIFDLYYPETMPTIVLTLEMDKDGITDYRFVPAWIDDWIPQPATGQLGREIMDRMADYSRPMNALVAVDPESNTARIHLTRLGVDSTVTPSEIPFPLIEEDGYRVSPPIPLEGQGSLSRVVSVVGDDLASWDVSWGREVLWHGGFEDEGATFWDVNTADEWLDESQSHSGHRSLILRRHDDDTEPTGTDLEKHLPCDPSKRHSGLAYVRAENASDAAIIARYYSSRYSSTPILSTDIGSRVSGTQDWHVQWQNLETPENGLYFEVRCSNDAPDAGTGYAWFDDIAFIEWEPWMSGGEPIEVPAPNNFRFLQIRSSDPGVVAAIVTCEETSYRPGASSLPDISPAIRGIQLFRSSPNPFNPRTRIDLRLSPGRLHQRTRIGIYDVGGRRVVTLFEGHLPAGELHSFFWDGTDQHGRAVGSGVYFSRAHAGNSVQSLKLLLLR
jgi:poly-gamma-glutamate capsule biosynthesis protein CapA/YwtB (metallophosphatase superfamily)